MSSRAIGRKRLVVEQVCKRRSGDAVLPDVLMQVTGDTQEVAQFFLVCGAGHSGNGLDIADRRPHPCTVNIHARNFRFDAVNMHFTDFTDTCAASKW